MVVGRDDLDPGAVRVEPVELVDEPVGVGGPCRDRVRALQKGGGCARPQPEQGTGQRQREAAALIPGRPLHAEQAGQQHGGSEQQRQTPTFEPMGEGVK
ncbi:hypothetical protein AQJ84_22390 [Streptomyces resistomycificus]|nr:hypothetical protein AQJ84_22390 [Streptomyces resistomycificus]